mgnify:CR=1 FL=1
MQIALQLPKKAGSSRKQLAVQLHFRTEMESPMSNVLKVIEILAESPNSWEDAAAIAVAKASETVRGVKSIYIKNFEAEVDNDKITSYRINAKVSFMVD